MSKKWFYLLCVLLLVAVVPKAALADHDHDGEHGRGHGYGHERHERDGDDDRYYYRDHDRELHEWYEAHRDRLPPGLARRDQLPPGLERQLIIRGTLPPGLRSRMHSCPEEVEQYLPPPPEGYVHTIIGGHIVLMNRRTFFVLDIFHFEM